MLIELKLYRITLVVACIVNLMMAASLLHNNYMYRDYCVYHRARWISALCLAVFAAGFALHGWFQWRTVWPLGATALSVSYFHVGGVLFSWSHTSLLNPNHLRQELVCRDVALLALGLCCYWLAATGIFRGFFPFIIFFLHIGLLTFVFYRTYYRVSRRLIAMQLGSVEGFIRWMLLSCHLIIGFGIGSIVFTAIFPVEVWPYTVLLCVGMAVFVYIFYSLVEYGAVIDSATNATEDVAEKGR